MTKRNLPWTSTLTDSVFALGAAARECQSAYQAAVIAKGHVDLDRIRLLDGKVNRRRAASYTTEQEPHLTALSRIGGIQLKAMHQLKRLYEDAARAYAHGTAWAVLQVQSGRQPAHVELQVDDEGNHLFAEWLPKLDLARYSEANALAAAHHAYERCLDAGAEAAEIDAQAYIADHEAGQMHRALDIAAGLPDAAYTYGVLAESALHFALNNRATPE